MTGTTECTFRVVVNVFWFIKERVFFRIVADLLLIEESFMATQVVQVVRVSKRCEKISGQAEVSPPTP